MEGGLDEDEKRRAAAGLQGSECCFRHGLRLRGY